jgi:hypothetical protein
MRDFRVIFERVPLICDNTGAISVAKKLSLPQKNETPLLRDHVENGDIEKRYIDTERQLADIFTKPLDASRFATLLRGIDVCHSYDLV